MGRREGAAVRLRALTALAVLALCRAAAPASAAPGPWIDPGRIAISPDGQDLYATGYRTLSFRRDVATGELTPIDELGPPGGSIAITPDWRPRVCRVPPAGGRRRGDTH